MTQVEGAEQYEALVHRAAELFAKRADRQEVMDELLHVKQALTEHMLAINRANAVVDAIAAAVAPDVEWQYQQQRGWFAVAKSTGPVMTPGQRKQRVLELAHAMGLEERSGRVKTRAIAERLRAEGETLPLSDSSTAIGNILSRTGQWERVGAGEYQFRLKPEVEA